MDYIGNKCPVCGKYFHADDDIVVCPECGTPHHRECYEELGHCANLALHSQGYDYSEQNKADNAEKAKICPRCGKENESDCRFCKNCGMPLDPDKAQRAQTAQNPFGQNPAGAPDGQGQAGSPFFAGFMDPLGGVPGDTDLGEGVTAGEAAKYVKQNTPYFIRIFSNIKSFNKSKFNFAAALFRGGYLLYRKMYKLGALITSIQLLMAIVESWLTYFGVKQLSPEFSKLYANAFQTYSLPDMMDALNHASATDLLIVYLPVLFSVVNIVMMVVIGMCFNRMYMNHCKKKIISIKQNTTDGENPETILQTKGGVNTALAVSLLVSSLLISYLPGLLGWSL